ncbi:MAG: putative hydrolase of the superfamily [Patescibacteria group bacterium]|nr:putative hydrolase of the superfamily [Patescibacteria group bacterium]
MVKFIILDFYNVLYFASSDKLNADILEFVKSNNKCDFGVLSAVSSDLQAWLRDRKIDENFVFVKTTAELGLPKTDPGIYEMVVNSLELKPSQVLMIDDTPENLSAADEAGLLTLRYLKSKPLSLQIKQAGFKL